MKLNSTKITNCLLGIIAITLIWIAIGPKDGGRWTNSVIPTASAQTNRDKDQPLQAICTLSHVDEAAARTLVGDLQFEVISTLNLTNATLGNMQSPLAEMQRILLRLDRELSTIAKNTSSY